MTPTEQTSARRPADVLIRAGRIHAMDPAGRVYKALAVRDDRVVAV